MTMIASEPRTEMELIEQLRIGEPHAFALLVRTYGGRMLSTALRILRNDEDAKDAVQDAFLAAHRSLDRFEGNSTIGTWLHRIVVNAALMKLRSRRRHPEGSIEGMLPRFEADGHRVVTRERWVEPTESLLERQEVRELVRRRIDQLPDEYRIVLLLRDIEDLDTAETASALGIQPGAVKTRLHRARMALRELLETDLGSQRERRE